MSRYGRSVPLLALLAGLSAACTLTFPPEAVQALRLFYELDASLPAGEPTEVQHLAYPEQVTLKKRFLRISGTLESGGDDLPRRLELVAETVDLESGRKLHTLRMSLPVAADGTFEGTKRLRKNLAAGSMTTVTVEPVGDDLARGTRVALCVDVVKRKPDLGASACIAGGDPPPAPPAAPTTFSGIQAEIFTPSCAKGGCHSSASASAGLVLAAGSAYGQLVNVPSNQVPFRLRVEPGNPDNSYLMMKLRGSVGISGVRMPLDGPPFLTDAQLDGIAAWIAGGAPND